MAKVAAPGSSKPKREMRPALTPDSRENQMIALAMDVAEERMRNGTASAQEIVHFLQLGTRRAKLQNRLLEAQTDMAIAKKESLQSQKRSDEMFEEAIKAFKRYSGQGGSNED